MQHRVGFIRDLTTDFSNYRRSLASNRGIGAALLSDDTPPPASSELFGLASLIDSKFNEVESKIEELSTLYKRRRTSLNEFTEEKQLDANILALVKSIKVTIYEISNILGPQKGQDGAPRTLRDTLKQGHLVRLQKIMFQFREMQQRADTMIATTTTTTTDEYMDAFDDFDSSLTHFTAEQAAMVMQEDIMRRDRLAAAQNIEQSMDELIDMCSEMAIIIHTQGNIVDCIHQKLVDAEQKLEDGKENLEKANEDDKKSSKWFYVYLICVVIAILITGSVILVKKKNLEKAESAQETGPMATPAVAAGIISLARLLAK